jgi:hypothetical protein
MKEGGMAVTHVGNAFFDKHERRNELRIRRRWEIKIQGVMAWIGFQIRSSDSSLIMTGLWNTAMKGGEYLDQLTQISSTATRFM